MCLRLLELWPWTLYFFVAKPVAKTPPPEKAPTERIPKPEVESKPPEKTDSSSQADSSTSSPSTPGMFCFYMFVLC